MGLQDVVPRGYRDRSGIANPPNRRPWPHHRPGDPPLRATYSVKDSLIVTALGAMNPLRRTEGTNRERVAAKQHRQIAVFSGKSRYFFILLSILGGKNI
jgi:hypothetical protein